jgi:hypothetical protein
MVGVADGFSGAQLERVHMWLRLLCGNRRYATLYAVDTKYGEQHYMGTVEVSDRYSILSKRPGYQPYASHMVVEACFSNIASKLPIMCCQTVL